MAHHSYLVKSAADTTAQGTLRSAILFANANPGTTITFAPKLAHRTITLSHELPLILGNGTVIDGSRAPHLTISGNDQFRVFFVGDTTDTVSATIENLTISHAVAKGGNGGDGAHAGGPGPDSAARFLCAATDLWPSAAWCSRTMQQPAALAAALSGQATAAAAAWEGTAVPAPPVASWTQAAAAVALG